MSWQPKNRLLTPVAAVAVAVAMAGVPSVSTATANAKITFDVYNVVATRAANHCRLTVPIGTNGLGILAAARAKGCIDSYSTYRGAVVHNTGVYVKCIETLCEKMRRFPARQWAVWENDEFSYDYTNSGLEWLRVDPGDHFEFVLEVASPIVIGI